MDEDFGEWEEYPNLDEAGLMRFAWKGAVRLNKKTEGIGTKIMPLKILSCKHRSGHGKNYEIDALFGYVAQWYSSDQAHEIGVSEPADLNPDGDFSICRLRIWDEPNSYPTLQWIDKIRDVRRTKKRLELYLPFSRYNYKEEAKKQRRKKKTKATKNEQKAALISEKKKHLLPSNDLMGNVKEPKNYRQKKNFIMGQGTPGTEEPNFCIWKSARRINKEGSRTGPYIWIPIKIVSIRRFCVSGRLYKAEILFAESTAYKKEVDLRLVGPKMELRPRENGKRMLYYAQFWVQEWTQMNLVDHFEKIRDVSPEENL